ncbi:hypothetical protein BD289DRAFT_231603 [Coniella lustricola]|uniref:Uncharacterized protein n=1 Tax=Coniella lustricola TaxID=2025994 RepID=A0A2T3AA70_9PEZI|nr:hypothetical protein BD289DRAFT_231603 [Coniella lustricola]
MYGDLRTGQLRREHKKQAIGSFFSRASLFVEVSVQAGPQSFVTYSSLNYFASYNSAYVGTKSISFPFLYLSSSSLDVAATRHADHLLCEVALGFESVDSASAVCKHATLECNTAGRLAGWPAMLATQAGARAGIGIAWGRDQHGQLVDDSLVELLKFLRLYILQQASFGTLASPRAATGGVAAHGMAAPENIALHSIIARDNSGRQSTRGLTRSLATRPLGHKLRYRLVISVCSTPPRPEDGPTLSFAFQSSCAGTCELMQLWTLICMQRGWHCSTEARARGVVVRVADRDTSKQARRARPLCLHQQRKVAFVLRTPYNLRFDSVSDEV